MYHVNKKFSTISRLKIFHKFVKLCKTLSTIGIISYPHPDKTCGFLTIFKSFPHRDHMIQNQLYQRFDKLYPQAQKHLWTKLLTPVFMWITCW